VTTTLKESAGAIECSGIPGLTLLELELFDTRFVGSNGCAFYTNGILLDGLGGIDGHLVVGLISVRKSLWAQVSIPGYDAVNRAYQVVVLEVDVEVSEFGSMGADESHDE